MEDEREQRFYAIEQSAKEVDAALANTSFPKIIKSPLAAYRSHCLLLTLLDFEFALGKNIESSLWDAHGKINGRFREQLAFFRGLKGKRKPVEQRKVTKEYLDFIKLSQHFYRNYVQQLLSTYDGDGELEAIALRFKLNSPSQRAPIQLSPIAQNDLLLCCHRNIVRLGDLSRYRESEVPKRKDLNWSPAIGYYNLAIAIYPASGIPHNQLAIIARIEQNHVGVLYHLYRAQGALEPHPTAYRNLELELQNMKSLVANSGRDSQGLVQNLEGSFLILHAQYFSGTDHPEIDKLESDVLSHLESKLTKGALETVLVSHLTIVNIAADFSAGNRWQDDPEALENERSFLHFQRLNLRTFSTLLQVFESRSGPSGQDGSTAKSEHNLSVVQSILPSLRHYQSWLASRAPLIDAQSEEPILDVHIKVFWNIYAKALRHMNSICHADALPILDYLLDEDEEVVGFKYFETEGLQQRFSVPGSNSRKPKSYGKGVKRHPPEVEMFCRIRDFLVQGLELARTEHYLLEELAKEDQMATPISSGAQTGKPNSSPTHISETNIIPISSDPPPSPSHHLIGQQSGNKESYCPGNSTMKIMHQASSGTSYGAGSRTINAMESAYARPHLMKKQRPSPASHQAFQPDCTPSDWNPQSSNLVAGSTFPPTPSQPLSQAAAATPPNGQG